MAKKPQGEVAIYYGDKRNTGEFDNGVWMDLLDCPFITKIDEAEYYKVVIRTLWLDSIGWSKAIRDKYPHVIQVGLSDHPLSSSLSKIPSDKMIAYLKDLEYLDGIMTLTDEENEWYTTAIPSKPVVKAGLPFPFKTYEARFADLRTSEKKFIGLGVGANDNDRNFISSVLVFNKLKLHYPDLQGVFLSLPPEIMPYTAYLADAYPDIFLHERTNMDEFYDVLSQCKFVISLADRNSPGRIQGEAAFFGIPVIGSNRLELQNELFPTLAVKPFETEQVFKLACELLENPQLGPELAAVAEKQLHAYDYASSKEIFDNLVKDIQSRG